MSEDPMMVMWVIYDHPSDYPDAWVARQWVFEVGAGAADSSYKPSSILLTAQKLDTLRAKMLERGYVCLQRDPNDDPKIVEAWL